MKIKKNIKKLYVKTKSTNELFWVILENKQSVLNNIGSVKIHDNVGYIFSWRADDLDILTQEEYPEMYL